MSTCAGLGTKIRWEYIHNNPFHSIHMYFYNKRLHQVNLPLRLYTCIYRFVLLNKILFLYINPIINIVLTFTINVHVAQCLCYGSIICFGEPLYC